MHVGDPTIITPVVPPIIPAASQPVRPAGDGSSRREATQQQERGTGFRAALDAATVGGLGEAFAALAGDAPAPADITALRAERRPTGRFELDAAEADGLYRAAQAQ